MLFWTIIRVAIRSLFANKLRSFLAMLGIIIGVAAVISMLAIGAGAQQQVMERFSAMGSNLLVVRPGARGTGGVMSGTQQTLTLEDAEALVDQVPGIERVAPVVGGNAQVKFMNKNSRVNVIGTTTTYLPARNFIIERGRAFTETEAERLAHVAVLGPMTVTNLFGSDDPIGEVVKMNGVNFRIIGVLKSKGDQGWFNPDDQVLIPYSTAMKQVFGVEKLREIDIEVHSDAKVNDVQDKATSLLRKRHRLQFDSADDFNVRNQAEMLETASSVSKTQTILLGCIGGISLLVGGIGIMNIMLVTVTERTREIGVRKAIGAKERDILSQFLLEAVMMCTVGGLLGVAFGIGTATIIGSFFAFSTIVEPTSIVVSLSFAALVGIFFGYYPARRAAGMDPIEALRYE